MSFYTVEVIFTGLCFFCFPNAPGTPQDAACPAADRADYVYMVNATEPEYVCGKKMPGDHEALLTFDRRYLEYADESLYKLLPAPGGGELVVAPLTPALAPGSDGTRGFDICFRFECVGPGRCDEPWPTPPASADPWPSLGDQQDAPKWYKPDANNIGWLARPPDVDKRCSQTLRPEVAGLEPDYVLGRFRLDWGTLSTESHARKPPKLLSNPYVVWGSEQQTNHMPKALAGAVKLTLPRLQRALLIQTGCAEGETPRDLFRLRGTPGSVVEIHVSNLPTHEVSPLGRAAQDHFRWYYNLFNYFHHLDENGNLMRDSQGDLRGDGTCPEDIAIPKILPAMSHTAWLEGVIAHNTLCPPGGK